jgi:multiple antibiotic resistance protein
VSVDIRLFGEVFVTLLVITDPPGTVPIFLALTGSMAAKDRHRAAWQAVALAGGVIVVFSVGGQQILQYLGVDLPALQGAGGILLLLVALELLTGKTDDSSRQVTTNVALVPIGTPLLAGPGLIVATMLFVRRANGPSGYLSIALGIVLVLLSWWPTRWPPSSGRTSIDLAVPAARFRNETDTQVGAVSGGILSHPGGSMGTCVEPDQQRAFQSRWVCSRSRYVYSCVRRAGWRRLRTARGATGSHTWTGQARRRAHRGRTTPSVRACTPRCGPGSTCPWHGAVRRR